MFRRKRTKSKGGFRILSRLVIILLIITSLILGLSLIFPLDYYEYIERYSEEYSLDPLLVASIINVESKYRMDAVSAKMPGSNANRTFHRPMGWSRIEHRKL